MIMATTWDSFDAATTELVSNQISFAEYTRRTGADFDRLARIVTRRRRPPTWYSVEDAKVEAVQWAHHYLFERVSADGTVGFDVARYRNPGAYVRQKVRQKLGKILSKVRGENQNTRRGPGAPEHLSKTGELGGPGGLPELHDDAQAAEEMIERARGLEALEALAETAREFWILRAMAQGMGDDRRLIAFLSTPEARAACGFKSEREIVEGVEKFVDEFAKKHRARKARATKERVTS